MATAPAEGLSPTPNRPLCTPVRPATALERPKSVVPDDKRHQLRQTRAPTEQEQKSHRQAPAYQGMVGVGVLKGGVSGGPSKHSRACTFATVVRAKPEMRHERVPSNNVENRKVKFSRLLPPSITHTCIANARAIILVRATRSALPPAQSLSNSEKHGILCAQPLE